MPTYHLTEKSAALVKAVSHTYVPYIDSERVLQVGDLVDLTTRAAGRLGVARVVDKTRPNEDDPTVLELEMLTPTRVTIGVGEEKLIAATSTDMRDVHNISPAHTTPHEAR